MFQNSRVVKRLKNFSAVTSVSMVSESRIPAYENSKMHCTFAVLLYICRREPPETRDMSRHCFETQILYGTLQKQVQTHVISNVYIT